MTNRTPGNRYEALEVETQEEENQEENLEMVQQQDIEPSASVPQHQEKEDQEEGTGHSKERKDIASKSEGSITRSRKKASSKEITDTSIEEQEPLSRKGRKSNKAIREQEAAREKAAGKQSNLDFLVKTLQANKYLLSAEEEKKEKDKALKQLRK